MLEIRNVVPYFASIHLVLNDGQIEIPVEDQRNNTITMRPFSQSKSLQVVLLGYPEPDPQSTEPPSPVWRESIVYPAVATQENAITMQTVLGLALEQGVDVVKLFEEAFDEIANEFRDTKDQSPGMAVMGPVVVYRPDAFMIEVDPRSPKNVTIKVGVYSAKKVAGKWEADKLKTNRYLTFEDSATKEGRARDIAQLEASLVTYADLEADLTIAVAALKGGNALPDPLLQKRPGLAQGNLASFEAELANTKNQLLTNRGTLADRKAIYSADLSRLIPKKDQQPTALQTKVMTAVVAACGAVLKNMKATREDCADMDVELILSKFSVPEV